MEFSMPRFILGTGAEGLEVCVNINAPSGIIRSLEITNDNILKIWLAETNSKSVIMGAYSTRAVAEHAREHLIMDLCNPDIGMASAFTEDELNEIGIHGEAH